MPSDSTPIDINVFTSAVKELPDDALVSLEHQLNKSILKLEATNTELHEIIQSGGIGENDKTLYNDVIIENKQVVRNQQERLQIVNDQLILRGFSDTTNNAENLGNVNNDPDKGIYL